MSDQSAMSRLDKAIDSLTTDIAALEGLCDLHSEGASHIDISAGHGDTPAIGSIGSWADFKRDHKDKVSFCRVQRDAARGTRNTTGGVEYMSQDEVITYHVASLPMAHNILRAAVLVWVKADDVPEMNGHQVATWSEFGADGVTPFENAFQPIVMHRLRSIYPIVGSENSKMTEITRQMGLVRRSAAMLRAERKTEMELLIQEDPASTGVVFSFKAAF